MISDSQVLVNSIEFPSLERSFEMAFEDFLVLQDAQVRKQKFDASTQLINMCNIICHNYVPWLSQIYNGDGCVRTLLKHQRTVDILAECNMRGMCIKVKRGPLLYKYLSWKTWQTHRISKTTKVKNRCEASAPLIFLLKSSLPFSCGLLFIYSCYKPQKNIRLIEIQWRQAAAPSLYMALLSVLTLPSGLVMFFPRSSATAGENMHKATARMTKLGFIWSGKSWVFGGDGIRSQNLLQKGSCNGGYR